MPDLPYTFHALFAALRISVWFWLLFVIIAPLFLKYIRNLPPIEKMIYSWLGLGGIILVSIFVLTTIYLYDLISMVLTLLLIPPIVHFIRNKEIGISEYLRQFELNTVVSHVKFIETYQGFSWQRMKKSIKGWSFRQDWGDKYSLLALIIAIIGGFTRMFSALQNASPFSRTWYTHLNRVKNLRLQEYFTDVPEPGGMHSLVSLFSMLTQVSPEMILHLLGALTSFFLCLIIYWTTKDLTRNEYPLAPILAMSVYALVPMLFLPLSLDQQIEGNALDLALCFAIPTITVLVRNLREDRKSPAFYVGMGVLATALTNLFVAFVILLPAMIIAVVSIPRDNYLRSLGIQLMRLLGALTLAVLPFVIYLLFYDLSILSFIRGQLYNTTVYSYYPLLLADLSLLSQYYTITALLLLMGGLVRISFNQTKKGFREIFVLIFFLGISAIYLPQLAIDVPWLDPDQLNSFYALLISILFGLAFASVMRLFSWIIRYHKTTIRVAETVMLIGVVSGLLYIQGGLQFSRVFPSTLPNGFFEAYYKIIDDHLPYSYATVGPEIDRTLSKNRHYFMTYDYFLNQYGRIDSLYHQWLSVPETERADESVPPPSIFIFVEKPPYGSIQQGILYNSGSVMRDVEQWIDQFTKMENRTVNTFYDTEDVAVYEIVNRVGESEISEILLNVQPADRRGEE